MAGVDAGTSTASVLFTDVVGSTELREQLGEEAADQLRRTHDEVVCGAIEAHHGRVVKSMGDGVMAVFDSAADAVAASVAVQQAVTAGPGALRVRVGISVGDVSFEDGDCFGSTVNEAARLCAAAHGGQILVADLVRALTRGRGGFQFESMGLLELKGIAEPVPACSVGWEPLPTSEAQVPFPPALVPSTATGPYVGRVDVHAALTQVWKSTAGDGPKAVLLAGEPGIGKTRTAYELARLAAEEGAVVLYGRCDEELQAPYQPFVEALDWQTRHAPDMALGRLAGELVRLVPDLGRRVPGLAEPVASDAQTEEHRLLEAVADWLTAAAADSGLVLVLDDLHWATKPTLQMLLHTVRQATAGPASPRLLVVGTYRDTDVDRAHPLSGMLGDLRRTDAMVRVEVDPLDRDEVVALVEQAAGHPLDAAARELAERAHRETEGNPFFVSELLRHLIEQGAVRFVDGRWVVPDPDAVAVPEGVRDVIGQRLSRLSPTANDALRAAAVVGREFDLDIVAALSGVDEDALLDALDETTRSRLVEELDADRFRFAHALVRTSLYEELSASRRRRMHRRVLEYMEAAQSTNLALLAHHAVEAGGDLSVAAGYMAAAADQARAASALAEADSLYRRTLELLDEDEAEPNDRRRLVVRCGLGEVQRDEGDAAYRETLLAVARDAEVAGHHDLLVRAAIANNRGITSIVGDIDPDRIEVLELALERVAAGASADRARLEALLASELVFDPEALDRRLALIDDAMELVDTLDDPAVTAFVLSRSIFAEHAPERWMTLVPRAQRGVEAADMCADPNLRVLNRVGLAQALLSTGNLVEAGRACREAVDIAARDAAPLAECIARGHASQFVLYEGRINDALAANDAVLALGEQLGNSDFGSWWASFAAVATWCRDADFGDPDLAGQFADAYPRNPAWRLTQAGALALVGRIEECRAVVEEHDLADPCRLARDVFWINCGSVLGFVVGALGDPVMARTCIAAYQPYEDAMAHFMIAVTGPVRAALARMYAIAGDPDRAIDLFNWCLDWATEQCPVFVPGIGVELAETYAMRGDPGDAEQARAHAEHVRAVADRYGATGWSARAERLLARLS